MSGFAFTKPELSKEVRADSPLNAAPNERVKWAGDGGAPTTQGMNGKDGILQWNSNYPDPTQTLTGTELAVRMLPGDGSK